MQDDYAENADQDRDWGSTESVPILTEACDQFQARTYKVFFPNDTFVSAIPMRRTVQGREELEARADRIGKHMSYQLGFLDRSYKQDKDALFLGVAVHGSFFTKTYFNERLRRAKTDNVRPTDLVISYNVGPVRIEDVRRKTHIIYTTVGETEDMGDFFITPATPAKTSTVKDNPYNIKVEEITGLSPSEGNKYRNQQAVLLEQHSFYDMGDGRFLPYVVTICAASRKVMRIVIGWEADEQGNPKDDYKQIQYFTHYKYAENPDGFYGLGLGHKIGDLNAAASIMLRQTIDAATLANDGNMSGFISEGLGLESDEIRFSLGRVVKIPDTVQDLQSAMMLMKFPGPNGALIELMQAIDQRAQRLGSVTEATTGSSEKNIQATTQLSMVEQALEMFSATQMRIANSLSEELNKIYKINQKFLPIVEYFVVNGEPQTITRADYADDMLVQPIFDPKYATQQQKIARAQMELQLTLQNPVNQGRPQVVDAAFKRAFKAFDVENVDELVPPQPQVENFDNQLQENMFFLMPQEARPLFDVFPDQNHMQHLMELQVFAAQYGANLQPEQIEAITKHQMKHTAYLYGQQNGLLPLSLPTPPLEARNGVEPQEGAAMAAMPEQDAAGLEQMLGLDGTFQG